MCGERDESITHLIAECKKLVQKEYKDMIILQESYIWNYARSLAQLVRLSGIITNLQVQLRMIVSKYCGVLISKQIMSSNTKDLTEKSEKNVTLFILLCLGTKGLSRKNRKRQTITLNQDGMIQNLSQVVVTVVVTVVHLFL